MFVRQFSLIFLYTENGNQLLSIVLPVMVIPVVVFMSIALFLGLVLVYLVSKKSIRLKRKTNQWPGKQLEFSIQAGTAPS